MDPNQASHPAEGYYGPQGGQQPGQAPPQQPPYQPAQESQIPQQSSQPYFAPPPTAPYEQSQQQPHQTQYYPPPPPQGHQGLYHPPPPAQQQFYPQSSDQGPLGPSADYKPYVPGEHGASSTIIPGKSEEAAPGLPGRPAGYEPPLPPRRNPQSFGEDDPSNPIHYARDPHKLVAYLVPFPKPQMKNVDTSKIPERFLIYTPPPPPLSKPKEGEKESKFNKVQRKWQEEVREAKTSDAKIASWKGVKGRATKGINWAMGKTTTSSLDFLNRIEHKPKGTGATHSDDEVEEGDTTKKTVSLEEMVLVYPSSVPGTQEELRKEFVDSMMRSKSKAQRDAVIATGLLPVGLAIDILATLVWPFGGLAEIDSVWLYSSLRGAKTARSTTKRLNSSGDQDQDKLRLTFTPSQRLEVLKAYLAARCHERDPYIFPSAGPAPTETQVLEAIGWASSQTGGETKNWEDEQWEITEVKDDLKQVMGKGAREWDKWCGAFEKNPEKALQK